VSGRLPDFPWDRLTSFAEVARAHPDGIVDLSVGTPVDAIILRYEVGSPRDARLDVLEAGHCVWEERAPEFESIVTQWVRGGFRG